MTCDAFACDIFHISTLCFMESISQSVNQSIDKNICECVQKYSLQANWVQEKVGIEN